MERDEVLRSVVASKPTGQRDRYRPDADGTHHGRSTVGVKDLAGRLPSTSATRRRWQLDALQNIRPDIRSFWPGVSAEHFLAVLIDRGKLQVDKCPPPSSRDSPP